LWFAIAVILCDVSDRLPLSSEKRKDDDARGRRSYFDERLRGHAFKIKVMMCTDQFIINTAIFHSKQELSLLMSW